jgi:hypothetical protein
MQADAVGHAIVGRHSRLKVALLAEGLQIDRGWLQDPRVKTPLRVRSGSCGGLDVILPDGTYVNCPIFEHFAASSPFSLVQGKISPEIVNETDGSRVPVQFVAEPAYYDQQGIDAIPLRQVGQLCSDRLGIGITNRCFYWDSKEFRCKFCSIGLNVKTGGRELRDKRLNQILEVVDAAYADPIAPARHLLLGGGTPTGPDAGAVAIAEAARAIKERWPDKPIYAMIAAPDELRFINLLHESGVDELGMNVEVFDPDVAQTYIPGKHQRLGLERYLRALDHAVDLFGPINTRSITVVGLDPADVTIKGAEMLASHGVMPILTPFRPMVGTEMEHHPRMSADAAWNLTVEAASAAAGHRIPLGPTCIPCQSNTLTVPGHPAYRYY